jgi:hypothetical protein
MMNSLMNSATAATDQRQHPTEKKRTIQGAARRPAPRGFSR